MTSAKRSNVQTRLNQHTMADDFLGISNPRPGQRSALRLGDHIHLKNYKRQQYFVYKKHACTCPILLQDQWRSQADNLDPVYTVPDPHGHDIKLDSFRTSVAFKDIII